MDKTIKDFFERIESECGGWFNRKQNFCYERDGLAESIKYEYYYGDATKEETEAKIVDEPILEDDILYCYAAAYTEWTANEFDLNIPDWVYNERSFMYEDALFSIGNTINTMFLFDEGISRFVYPSDEFAKRGFYFLDKDQQIV